MVRKRDPGSLTLLTLSTLTSISPPHSLREQRKEPPPPSPFRSWKLSDLAIHDLLLLTSLAPWNVERVVSKRKE